MILLKVIIFALIGTTCSLILKQIKPELSIFVMLGTGVIIIFEVLDYASAIVNTFTTIGELTGVDGNLFKIILKIIGIGYLIEFSSSLCSDSGLNNIASKIQFAGKIIILFIALPIINALIEIIIKILKLC